MVGGQLGHWTKNLDQNGLQVKLVGKFFYINIFENNFFFSKLFSKIGDGRFVIHVYVIHIPENNFL